MKHSIYVTDLDGTLLNQQGALSWKASWALRRWLRQGLPFTIATGRSPTTVRQALGRRMPFELPLICMNGALVWDYHRQKPLFLHELPQNITEVVLHQAHQRGLSCMVLAHDGRREQLIYTPDANDGVLTYLHKKVQALDDRLRKLDSFAQVLGKVQILSLTFTDEKTKLSQFASFLKSELNLPVEFNVFSSTFKPDWGWLTVQSEAAGKGKALLKMIEHLGMSVSEIVVFGDYLNDRDMFRVAHRGVAVANAHEEIKGIAHEVIGHHHDESVIHYLRREIRRAG